MRLLITDSSRGSGECAATIDSWLSAGDGVPKHLSGLIGAAIPKGTRMITTLIIIALWAVSVGFQWYHITVAQEEKK